MARALESMCIYKSDRCICVYKVRLPRICLYFFGRQVFLKGSTAPHIMTFFIVFTLFNLFFPPLVSASPILPLSPN